jgi:hypothetical protein
VAAKPSAATDDIEAALAAAREAERAAERAVERLSQLSGRKGGTGGRAEALRAAVAALQSLRSALAADPGNEALGRALEETKKAVEALERAPGRAGNAQGPPRAGNQ